MANMVCVGQALEGVQRALKVKKELSGPATDQASAGDDYPLASAVPGEALSHEQQLGGEEDVEPTLEVESPVHEDVEAEFPPEPSAAEAHERQPEGCSGVGVTEVPPQDSVQPMEPVQPEHQGELKASEESAEVGSGEQAEVSRAVSFSENQLGDPTLYPRQSHEDLAAPPEPSISDAPMRSSSEEKANSSGEAGDGLQASRLKRQRHLESQEELGEDFILGGDSVPPPVLTKNAIQCRLRRIFKKRADGTTRLSQSWNDQWADEAGKAEIESMFEKLGYNVERACKQSMLGSQLSSTLDLQFQLLFPGRRSSSSGAKQLLRRFRKRRWRLRASGSQWQTCNVLASVSAWVGLCPCLLP